MKKIIIILDGLGDIGKKTPLDRAKTPNLDYLAKNGKTGLMYPIKGIAPESGASQFAMLGYPLNKYPGRGPIEALGAGLKIRKGYVYLRCNFAEFKKNKLTKIRVPNPSKNLIKKINKIDKDIKLIPTKGYRAVMIVKNLKGKVSNTHPGYKQYKNFSKAITSNMKKRSSKNKKIDNFIRDVEKTLKNKTILIRGFGNKLPKLKKLRNWSLIADMPVEHGLGKLVGMKIVKRKKDEIKQVIKLAKKSNVYLQIKGPDNYGHVGNNKGKIKAIEKIDKILKPLTKLKNTLICITSDHSTPCSLKRHSKDPVPLLVYRKSIRQDRVSKFSERACSKGSIGKIQGKKLMKIIYKLQK